MGRSIQYNKNHNNSIIGRETLSTAFESVIKMTTMKKLQSTEILLIEAQSVTRSPVLSGIKRKDTDFTDTSKTCPARAIIEG